MSKIIAIENHIVNPTNTNPFVWKKSSKKPAANMKSAVWADLHSEEAITEFTNRMGGKISN